MLARSNWVGPTGSRAGLADRARGRGSPWRSAVIRVARVVTRTQRPRPGAGGRVDYRPTGSMTGWPVLVQHERQEWPKAWVSRIRGHDTSGAGRFRIRSEGDHRGVRRTRLPFGRPKFAFYQPAIACGVTLSHEADGESHGQAELASRVDGDRWAAQECAAYALGRALPLGDPRKLAAQDLAHRLPHLA